MSVNICLPLFGDPGRELEAESAVRGLHLRQLAEQLQERLLHAADILDRLQSAGWRTQVALYEVILTHAGIETREQAEKQLRAAGVDPQELMILEEVEEDEAE